MAALSDANLREEPEPWWPESMEVVRRIVDAGVLNSRVKPLDFQFERCSIDEAAHLTRVLESV